MSTNRNETVEEFYRANYNRLVKSVKSRVGENAAEDVVQEAFTKCLRYFNAYNSERGSFDTWFGIVLTNITNDYLNAERSGGSYSDEGLEEVVDDSYNVCSVTMNEIKSVIDSEKSNKSEVLRLHFLLGYTQREIASVTANKVTVINNILSAFSRDIKEKYA